MWPAYDPWDAVGRSCWNTDVENIHCRLSNEKERETIYYNASLILKRATNIENVQVENLYHLL